MRRRLSSWWDFAARRLRPPTCRPRSRLQRKSSRRSCPPAWHFEITGYGWGTSIAGSTGFGSLPTLPYYAPFPKLLEHFQGGFMSSFVARNDTFIGGIDFVWARIGGSGAISKPGQRALRRKDEPHPQRGVHHRLRRRSRAARHRRTFHSTARSAPATSTAGPSSTVVRPVRIVQRDRNREQGLGHPVAGFAAQYRYDDRWFMNMLADLGGWSDSATGQALASVGYNWTQNLLRPSAIA